MALFIIAEAGVNHNNDIYLARKMIDAACEAGADAVKFQTFKAANLASRLAQKAKYQIENMRTSESQYEMLKKLELPYEIHFELKSYCESKGIVFMSTPFDFESADFLESLNIGVYKISSGDLTNIPFLKYIALKGKPIILSTGMSTLGEIEEALNAIYSTGNKDVTVLHCTTNYPTQFSEVNLNAMKTIESAFNVKVGYSDHTEGIEIPIAAAALGAKIIEKHFTLDKNMEGPDHKASLEPHELKLMVTAIRRIEISLGDGFKRVSDSEKSIMGNVRKSIIAVKEIKKNSIITEQDLCIKRPATGIEPKYYEQVIGKGARSDIPAESPIRWQDIE